MSIITMEQVAAMSVQYVHYSLDYYLDSMKRCGIKNVDIWGATPHYCRLNYLTRAEAARKIRDIRKKVESMGMKIVMYTPETLGYPYDISSPEQIVRDRTLDYFDMAMDDVLEMGTNKIFINTGCGLLDVPHDESWKYAAETASRICEMAEERGIYMVLEQLQPYESNLVTTLPEISRFVKEVNSPALKICVDLVAMEVAGEKLEDYYQEFGEDMIQLIHYADGDPSGHYILGDGNAPLKEYIKTLEAHNYKGIIDLEINDSIYWEDPHTSIQKSVDYLREFLPEHP